MNSKNKRKQLGLFLCAVVLCIPFGAAAKEKESTGGVKPNSVLYWFDTAWERMKIWFADTTAEEVQRLLGYADEKLLEAKALASTDSTAASEAMERYETYIREAAEKVVEAQEDGAQVDDLLEEIASRTITQLQTIITIGSLAGEEHSYVAEALETLAEQQKAALTFIADADRRSQTVEKVLKFLEEQRSNLPADLEDDLRKTIESLMSNLVVYIIDVGQTLFNSLSESAKGAVKNYVETQMDSLRDELVKKLNTY